MRITAFDEIQCDAAGCVDPVCGSRACWLREGYRLAVDVAVEAVDDGAPGWLPNRMCEVAADMLPLDWPHAGAQYAPKAEEHAAVRAGEVWTVTGGFYVGKPRPAVVVQGAAYARAGAVTVCPMTSLATDAPPLRVQVDATEETGLAHRAYAMVDKITTVPRGKVRTRLGAVSDDAMARIEKALLAYLFGVT